jgi:hypothetical protein
MKKNFNESISFILKEFKRLKLKEKEKKITKEEQTTLHKLISFLGKTNDKQS